MHVVASIIQACRMFDYIDIVTDFCTAYLPLAI